MPATPPKEKQFKKGQSGNPSGRKKLPEHLRDINKLTKDEVNCLFAKYVRMTRQQMKETLERNDVPMLEMWIASGIAHGVREGDWYNMGIMFDRIFGRTKPEEAPKLPPIESESHIAPPANEDEDVERYVVLMNKDGKFEHARPRLVQAPKP